MWTCKLVTIHEENERGPRCGTRWTEKDRSEEVIPEGHYDRIIDAAPFFRRLGGSEYFDRRYTKAGMRVYKHISTSPDKTRRTIRIFSDWREE